MFRPRIIPCLLLKDLGLVKTIQFKNPRYIGDPMNAVKIFNDFEADELVFLDIEASKKNRMIDINFVKKVSEEAFMPFAVGGGISNIEQIRNIMNSGAEKVIINTFAMENPLLVKEASEVFGSQAIIVSIDAKKEKDKYFVFTHGGTKKTRLDPADFAKKMECAGAGEILITSIDNDGLMNGYDINLIRLISNAVKIPVIANGGAGDLDDLNSAIVKGGASAGAAGSIFVYSGKNRGILINYPDKDEIFRKFLIS